MKRTQPGFTLIEIMIVLLIVAIALGLGTPALQNLVERTRTRTTMEDIVELLRLARLTAVEQMASVTVCASADGSTCSGAEADWSTQLIAFRPDPEDASQNKPIMSLNISDSISLSHNKTYAGANGSGGYTLDFQANGWTPGDQASLFVCPENGNSRYAYRIFIAMSGKIRVQPYANGADWSCGAA